MAQAHSTIPGYTSHQIDGRAFIGYYNADHSFAWTGSIADPIEISYGGYGEPVTHLIDVRAQMVTPREGLVAWFQSVCDEWAYWHIDNDATDATVARFDTANSASRQHYIETGVFMLTANTHDVSSETAR